MRGYYGSLIAIVVMCLLVTGGNSTPLGNRWYPTDSRCSGSVRVGRSVTTNNDAGQYWVFNGNLGSCEKQLFSSTGAFSSKSECDKACLNIYHFS